MSDPPFPSPGTCPSRSSPTGLREETRPQVNSASSVCLCQSCLQAGGGHCTCTKQPLLPELLISLPCPNSITSGPAIASGFQLGVTGSLDSRQEVGVGWFRCVGEQLRHIHRAGQYARCYITADLENGRTGGRDETPLRDNKKGAQSK